VTRFDRPQLVAFIRAIDRNLAEKVKVVVIGGAAATVGYDCVVKTADIDIFRIIKGSSVALGKAADLARQETGLGVSVAAAPVADLPYNYERRLKPVRGLQLVNLTVVIPDKYDLALSKTIRGYPHDIEAIQSMHESHRLARKTLVARFESELMKVAIADPRKISLNLVMVVARIYGFEEGRKLAERWKLPVPRSS
jgi:Nucleotidyltransferase of unknown function (DUF6036)